MPVHLILLVVAFVLLLLAGIFELPWTTPPRSGWPHALGWFGLAAFVLAALVP